MNPVAGMGVLVVGVGVINGSCWLARVAFDDLRDWRRVRRDGHPFDVYAAACPECGEELSRGLTSDDTPGGRHTAICTACAQTLHAADPPGLAWHWAEGSHPTRGMSRRQARRWWSRRLQEQAEVDLLNYRERLEAMRE